MAKRNKLRVYRNLNRGTKFSYQRYKEHRGWIVEGYLENAILLDCEFIASEAGAKRVQDQQRKNVHAFIYCDQLLSTERPMQATIDRYGKKINYDPYEGAQFTCQEEVLNSCSTVVLAGGKAYKI